MYTVGWGLTIVCHFNIEDKDLELFCTAWVCNEIVLFPVP
jgi:hypothetical protein